MSGISENISKSPKKERKINAEKVFVVRDSIHTVLMKNDHIKSVYYMCIAIFLIALMDNISHDFLTSGKLSLGFQTIKQGFGKLHVAFIVWSLLHVPIIVLYYALQAWHDVLRKFKTNSAYRNIWSLFCIFCFGGMQLTLLYVSTKACLAFSLPFASASALLMETFRLMMKAHAFVRTNAPRLLADHRLSSVSAYLYYLFAPTFIYRDSYPRTEKIRWKIPFISLSEMAAIIFLLSFIHEGYILPNFQNFGSEQITTAEIAKIYFGMMLPSNLIFLCANYFFTHCWLNFTGELMRFGDRLYYEDWWTSRDFKTYYRSWNITVHEWFYEFIYKDFYQYVFKGSEVGSSLAVFALSTFMHEYVLSYSMRIFFPILSVLYGIFGVIFFFTTSRLPHTIGKVFVWLNFLIGSTILVTFYAIAYYCGKYSF